MFNKFESMNMETTKHEQPVHHQELFNAAWEKSNENRLVKGLKSGQKIDDLLREMPGFTESFSEKSLLENPDCCFECSDGRVKTSGVKVAIAGEGILLGAEDRLILEKALANKGIVVTGHEGCGAAAMAHPGHESDKRGYESAWQLSEKTGNQYKEIYHEEFRSPVHDERALVIEGTLKFNCAAWSEFPPQFIASSAGLGLSDAYIATEARTLTGIALGAHGLGSRFDSENPFYVIISAKDQEQLDHLLPISRAAVSTFRDRVVVTGFIAPGSKE